MGLPETWWLLVAGTVLIALVASGGFWFGRHRVRHRTPGPHPEQSDIQRASSIVAELSTATRRLHKALANQGPAVRKFSARLGRYERRAVFSMHELYDRADEMLKSTLRFTAELSQAYGELVQQLTHLSSFAELRTDPVTGAANRRALDEALNPLLAEQARHAVPLSVAMVDIDFFKQLNDTRSNMRGDRVLKDLAEVLSDTTRQCDLVARFGGEEFVIVMPHTDVYGAGTMAERIRISVQERLPITVSIGLAASAHGDSPSTLFSRADAALYLAKAAGRNCVYLHEGASGGIVGVKARGQEKPPAQTCGAGTSSTPVVVLPNITLDSATKRSLSPQSMAGH